MTTILSVDCDGVEFHVSQHVHVKSNDSEFDMVIRRITYWERIKDFVFSGMLMDQCIPVGIPVSAFPRYCTPIGS